MNILGISDVTGNHSHSCVAILQDGHLAFALSEERISRVKNDPRFPSAALQAALDYTGLRLNDIDAFACGYPPANYYGSLLHSGTFDLPRSVGNTLLRRPLKLGRYLLPNLKKGVLDPKASNGLFDMGVPAEKFRFVDHHRAHVSAGYFSSGFDEALAISYGGFAPHASGQNVAGAVYYCQGDAIELLEDIPMYATGCYVSGVTVALGFRYMEQEGKTMGLAKTADYHDCYDKVRKLTSRFRQGEWKKYKYWIDYIMSPRADVFLGSKSGHRLEKLIAHHGGPSVAAAAQRLWEKNIVHLVRHYQARHGIRNLVLTGGTFLNGHINRLLAELQGIDAIYVFPHTGDGSTAIGAALETHRELTGTPARPKVFDTGWGVDHTEASIETAIRHFGSKISYEKIGNPALYAAKQLATGKIVGWFQGREEYGPRTLGHRCILGDPRSMKIKVRMTRDIKGRELWIPIAPSVLEEHGDTYFQNFCPSPFMTRVFVVKPKQKKEIEAALHQDGSVRLQSVGKAAYKPFRQLLQHFYKRTDMPMLLNTSLNRHGEPIVHRPKEAIQLLLDTPLDVLVIGPFAVTKG